MISWIVKRHRYFSLLVLITLSSSLYSKENIIEQYRIFKDVRNSFESAKKYLPKEYTVPVYISGPVAEELLAQIDSLGIEKPGFAEHLGKDKQFTLLLSNKNYSTRTRELLSGILNPIEMIDAIMKSVLKFSEESFLKNLEKETSFKADTLSIDNHKIVRVTLTPNGNKFNYIYKDMGAYMLENWLSELTLDIQPESKLATELSYVKHTRLTGTSSQERKKPKISKHTFKFKYEKVKDIQIPSALRLYINNKPTAALSVNYRELDRFILFDKRKVKYIMPDGNSAELFMEYGEYSFTKPPEQSGHITSNEKYSKNLKKAAERAREASQAIKNGKLTTAANILKTIVDRYPGTPQAVEASRILTGLFGNTE